MTSKQIAGRKNGVKKKRTVAKKSSAATVKKKVHSDKESALIGELDKQLQAVSDYLKSKSRKWYICAGYTLTFANIIFLILRYIYCVCVLNRTVATGNILYVALFGAGPIGLWIFSTFEDYFNFHIRKLMLLGTVVFNAILILCQYAYMVSWRIFVPRVLAIPTNQVMTQNMVLNLARLSVTIPTILVGVLLAYITYQPLFSQEGIATIEYFKISHYIDTRKNKDSAYDCVVMKDLKTGQDFRIKEDDRFIHMMVNGATGTGKTSSVFMNSINNDLERKLHNSLKRQAAYLKMVSDKKAVVINPKEYFTDDCIVPYDAYREEYEAIKKRWPDCGLTILAPNSGLTDDVVRLCNAKGIAVNVIDPTPDPFTGQPKEHLIGMNPFAVPDNLNEDEMAIQISEKASNFADVMTSISTLNGNLDPYFAGINSSVTTNVAKICMRAVPLIEHRQATINDVQECINDYRKLAPMVTAIEDFYGIMISPSSVAKDTSNTGPIQTLPDDSDEDRPSQKNLAEKEKKGRENPYRDTIYFVKYELLGEGAEKMYDQSRGLRNLINGFLMNPRVNRNLTMEHTIDFDGILHSGEITVCNTAAELGNGISTAFGLFMILSMKQATYRRKINDRMNHFWYIDEFALYLLPDVEQMFTLFRQYRVGMAVAIQTLDQMEKSATTKYLKGVITNSCGTQIIFGRVNLSEMELYSKLAGKSNQMVIQESVTKSSILSNNPDMRTQERIAPENKNNLEGTDIRTRDFQEVTVFTVDHGRIIHPFFAKVSFMDRKFYEPSKNIKRIPWEKYAIDKPTIVASDKKDLSLDEKDTAFANAVSNDVRPMESEEVQAIVITPVKKMPMRDYLHDESPLSNDETRIPLEPWAIPVVPVKKMTPVRTTPVKTRRKKVPSTTNDGLKDMDEDEIKRIKANYAKSLLNESI